MIIKVKKVHKDAQLPKFAHENDTGADLYSVENVVIPPGGRAVVDNGIQIAVDEGSTTDLIDLQVRSRSGLAAKNGVSVLNSPGTIDIGYRGNLKTILMNHSNEPFEVKVGDRIAQLVVSPRQRQVIFQETETLDETDRSSGGFGSSGR